MSTNPLTYPLYADKPKRTIPGTDVVAVTMYRSQDNTVRRFALITKDGAHLGNANYHPKTSYRSACYTMTGESLIATERWSTLAEFAAEMKRRHGIES